MPRIPLANYCVQLQPYKHTHTLILSCCIYLRGFYSRACSTKSISTFRINVSADKILQTIHQQNPPPNDSDIWTLFPYYLSNLPSCLS